MRIMSLKYTCYGTVSQDAGHLVMASNSCIGRNILKTFFVFINMHSDTFRKYSAFNYY